MIKTNELKPYEEYQSTEYDWLPKVPRHWEKRSIRSLTQLSDERNGNRNDLELLSVYREYGVIRKASRNDNHNVESLDLSNYKYVGKDYLVMNKMKMWQGSLGVSNYEGIVSPAYIVCHFSIDANYKYFHYLLRSAKFKTQYNRISYGIRVGQWDMRYNDFKNINLFIPPRQEQDQIVKFLDLKISKINKFIIDKKREIELLKEQKQAEINRAITKGLNSDAPMKDSGIDWLGKIPEHWEIKYLRNLLTIISIKNRPELPLLSVVREKGVILRDVMSKEENHNFIPDDLSGYKMVLNGQFVINKMKAWQGSYGVSNYEGIVSPAYYIFNLTFPNKKFFHIAIRSKIYVNFFAQYSDGIRVGQWDLSSEKMKMIPFFVPPASEQNAIIEYTNKKFEVIDEYIVKIEQELNLAKDYKTSLISEVVTGKVDVRDVKINAVFEMETLDNTEIEIETEEVIEE